MLSNALLDDYDLLARIGSLSYCYSVRRKTPPELLALFDVAYSRGLLDTTL